MPVPAWYEYNTYGSLVHLHTFREGVGWSAGIWPSDAGEGDVTTWIYDEATGLLSEKRYADSKGVTYTYLAGGRLHTRTWARIADGAAPVTTYGYNSATGELSDISYSDETPAIALTCDRAGRKDTVTDALGTRTFTYDGVSPDTEILSGLYERTIDYDYESAANGVPGRLSGFSAGPEYRVSYVYEHGRISGVNREISGQTGAVSYGYENGLVTGIFFNGGPTVTRTYDPAERYLTQVKNEGADGVISQYDYTHDNLGRRKTLTYSGSAFDGDSYRRFAYNDRSGVTASSAYTGSNITDISSPLPSENRSYTYDPVGNRTAATDWNAAAGTAQSFTYTANELNQYTEIAADTQTGTPEYDDDGNMIRLSADSAVMTYNAENRLSSVEYETLAGDVNGDGETNLSDAVSALQVVAGVGNTGTADGDINGDYRIGIEEAVYCLRVAAGLEDPVITERKLVFTYDYMGRRVKKAVYSGNADTPGRTVLFVWNGWNMIEEITGQGGTESSRYFVWGLDFSQSMQGAGGIGGLLCTVNGDAAYDYLYDGNGNAGQVVNAGNGAVAAHYEYDPFGNLTAKSGLYADANPFRFSTKYLDAETGLYYYGFRYYSPEIGRWISRDPIEEAGGINLYNLTLNNPINIIDFQGLANIMIDPGHGDVTKKWLDPGALGINNKAPHEKDYALALALEIGIGLTNLNHKVFFTRTGDIETKQKRLKWRTDKANEACIDYFISIHLDSYSETKNHFKAYYGSESGKELADLIAESVGGDEFDSAQSIERPGLYVIKYSKPTAILIEAGNIKNSDNKKIIESEKFINST